MQFLNALNNKGVVLSRLNKIDESLECYEKAINLNPNYMLAVINKNETLTYKVSLV